MKKWHKNSLIIFMTVLIGLVFMFISTSKELKKVRNMTINNVSLYSIKDGVYPGSFSYGGFEYKVKVTMIGYRIINVEIVANRDTKHAKMAEGVVKNIVRKQKLDVDVISGATTTSKALLKATENALTK